METSGFHVGGQMADRPHFAFPFERGANGKVNVVEQDTVDHIRACEHVIIRCPAGFREDRPEFGWWFPIFQNIPLDLGPLREALAEFEPRGPVMSAREYIEAAQVAVRRVELNIGITDNG